MLTMVTMMLRRVETMWAESVTWARTLSTDEENSGSSLISSNCLRHKNSDSCNNIVNYEYDSISLV